MKTKIYIDKNEPYGSEVWNLYFRNGEIVNCLTKSRADKAMVLMKF